MRSLSFSPRDLSKLSEILKGIEFFEGLTVKQMNIVLPCAQLWECRQHEIIFSQGAPGDSFHIIQNGRVAVYLEGGFLRKNRQITTLGPGEYFGEIALLYPEPRSATIECIEPTRIFTFVTSSFNYILTEFPELAEKIGRVAERRRYEVLHTE